MNPFDLRGPEFLVFYVLLGAVVLAAIALRRWFSEPQPPVHERLTDPFSIAYLRGGSNEVLRLATLSLVERKLLEADGTVLKRARAEPAGVQELERLVLGRFEHEAEAREVFADGSLQRECDLLRDSLASAGLVPDAGQRSLRWWTTAAAIALLAVVALVKIQVALARGKSNVLFLIVLAIAFSLGAVALAQRPHRTPRGTAALRDLQSLFERARSRLSSTASAAEFMLLAATFGVTALPDPTHAARAQKIFPKASSSGCGSTCGSSCGTSGGGSSCGGGCGGGCGGCGGD